MLNPTPSVEAVLEMTGIKALIPIYSDPNIALIDLLAHTAGKNLTKGDKGAG